LIPFEIPNSGGRRYFRNAGETSRSGAELGVTAVLGAVDLGGALALLRYRYEEFRVGTTVLDGKKVPGVSPLTSSLFVTGRRSWGFATLEMQQSSRSAADDANVTFAPGYVVWNARTGLTGTTFRGVEPVVGVENVFGRTYSANVVTNATRGRFFEPGAGRRMYVALSVSGTRR
jgi:iron complex outermembrane receptor protein